MSGAVAAVEVLGSENVASKSSFIPKPFKTLSVPPRKCLALFCGLHEWKVPSISSEEVKKEWQSVFRES